MARVWSIEYTDEFGEWFESLTDAQQDAVDRGVRLLEQLGPGLGRPYVDTIKRSRHPNMKELRTQVRGRPLRTFFAFDPRQTAILLIGGNKTGDTQFYHRLVPVRRRALRPIPPRVARGRTAAMKHHKFSRLRRKMSPARRAKNAAD